MLKLEHTGWTGSHEGYQVGDYFAAAGVDPNASYATEAAAQEAMLAVTTPDAHGVAPLLSIVEAE